MVVASKITSVAVAVVVTIIVGVVIAASLGTQDDVPQTPDPQPIHAPSEIPDTVNGTSVTLVEPQDGASQTTDVGNGTPDTLTEPQESAPQTMEPQTRPAPSEEFETVDVGIMLRSYDDRAAVSLGVADFNAHLEEIGAPWRMNLVFVDAQSNPTSPLEKIHSLNSKDVKFVLGPASDAEIHSVKSYARSNDMVLISPSSASPSLAADDNIFRLAPGTAQQGRVLALLFEQEGIRAVITVHRSDVWGSGLYESARDSFETLGGVMDDSIPYPTNTNHMYFSYTGNTFEPALLSDLVDEYTGRYPADEVAVLVIGFSEIVHLLDSAGSFDSLHNVRWFGSDPERTAYFVRTGHDNRNDVGWFGSDRLSMGNTFWNHRAASAFAQDVSFVSVRSAPSINDVSGHVLDYFADSKGRAPDTSAFSSYDSVWILGRAILETGSVDPLTVRDSIIDVAATHTGAIGAVNLNEFGDFATPDYDLWGISNGAWHKSGHFDADSDTFDFVTDRDMTRFDLPKVVDVGLLMPPHYGEWTSSPRYDIMANLGLADFNSYLEEIDASWRMNLVVQETLGDPAAVLERIRLLDSNGIKFVLGPERSAEIRHIKSYVDYNDMVLISPTSTSPSLAIADNIFRMIPDDAQQGKALSLLFEREGIEAVVPIYRGDVWGDGVYESTRNSFEALGGVMDDGVRYSPEATAYSTEAALLSGLIDKYTGRYPADKVAVLMIGFYETVRLLDSVASFDNLHDVRWFGSDGSSNDTTLSDDPTASAFLQDVGFVGTRFDTSRNDVYAHVQERFMNHTGRTAGTSSFPMYDGVWVLGKAILEAGSVDPLTVRDSIIDVAATYTGTIGTVNLNEFGDFATPSYGLWSIRDGAWYKSGHFDGDDGTFSFT